MKGSAALVALIGCSRPEGLAQVWPPGPALAVVVGGDLNGDAITDVVASGGGIYVAFGGTDVGAHPTPIQSFTRYLPQRNATDVEVVPRESGALLAVASAGEQADGVLEFYDTEHFSVISSVQLPSATRVWLDLFSLSSKVLVVVGTDTQLWTIDPLGSSAQLEAVNPPAGGWSHLRLATTVVSGGVSYVVVATDNAVYRAPSNQSGSYSWAQLRNGDTWSAQTFGTIGDAAVLVGLDASTTPSRICAIDLSSGSGAACISLLGSNAYNDVAMALGNFEAPQSADLFVVHSTTAGLEYELYAGLSLSGTNLLAGHEQPPAFLQGTPPAYAVSLEAGDGRAPRVLIMDSSGTFQYCFEETGSNVESCR